MKSDAFYDLYGKVLSAIKNGMTITFTPNNIADGDNFLIFSYYKEHKVIFHTSCVPYWLEFSSDEPFLLENVPESFLRSILKNIPKD